MNLNKILSVFLILLILLPGCYEPAAEKNADEQFEQAGGAGERWKNGRQRCRWRGWQRGPAPRASRAAGRPCGAHDEGTTGGGGFG